MTISALLTRPCTVVHRTGSDHTDKYGNEISGEVEATTVCEVQQAQRREPGNEGEVSDVLWAGYFPAGTLLTTADAVRVEGIGTLEVVGEPWTVRSPTGPAHHVEATLRRTAGAEEGS